MSRFCSLLAFVVCSLSAEHGFSKDNQLPGYIVLSGGDTLRGSISYSAWNKNPLRITFQETGTTSEKHYTPIDIRAFSVNGETYESAIVDIDNSPIALDYSPNPEIIADTVFLKLIFRGDKRLYYLKGNSGKKQLYVASGDEAPQLLIYRKYHKDVQRPSGVVRGVVENTKYRNQLIALCQECPDLFKTIERTSYNVDAVRKVFSQYQACVGRPLAYEDDHTEVRVEAGVFGGITVSQVSFESTQTTFNNLAKADFNKSITPTFGFFVDWHAVRGKPLTLTAEGLITSLNLRGSHTEYINANWSRTSQSSFDFTYTKLNAIVKYGLFGSNPGLYVMAGGTAGYAISGHGHISISEKFFTSQTDRFEGFASRNFTVGWMAGIGVRLNRFGLEARYEKNDGFSAYSTLRSSLGQVHVILKYSLKK